MVRSFISHIAQIRAVATLRNLITRKWLLWLGVPLAALVTGGVVMSSGAPATNPLINLATEPLYARGVRAKPALALALSVEFPTVGQTYQGNYSETTEYVGYFNSTSCYTYDDPTKQFNHTGRTTTTGTGATLTYTYLCNGAGFSGNFMNWATSSAIDILRYGLTGGDRIVDLPDQTVLQRAVLQKSFYNSTNFAAKSISATIAANALPTSMMSNHSGVTVYIANCLNRVYFGTQSTGSCDSPGNNANLGTPAGAAAAPAGAFNQALPPMQNNGDSCANEGATCMLTGTKEVWYGAGTSWKYKVFTGSAACSNTAFDGDPLVGIAKKCYYREAPSGGGSTPSGTALTTDAFFTTRVQVCTSGTNGLIDPRPDLCTRYPNGNYKPTGNLQTYADTVRVAAFGYLNDSSGARYGGVLRAPMKYVGPKSYNTNFNLEANVNARREWDTQTGVFERNPEANQDDYPQTSLASPISGVINYLNQFGRTGTTPGTYKTYDPVGELYYETLRYLQGLPPTPQAISGLTDANRDGYPVYTTWTDPMPAVPGLGNTGDYSCVKTNILTIGDIHTHYDRSLPGYTGGNSNDFARNPVFNLAGNEPNFKDWTAKVGVFEGRTNLQNETSQDDGSFYMAGAAYWAHVQDIRGTTWTTDADKRRPGMRVKTYIIDVDEYGEASGNASIRKSSDLYLAAKYGGFNDVSNTGNPFINANGDPDPTTNWMQANGDARTYFLAGNPKDMLASIKQIFDQIVSEANSIAGAAIDTVALQNGDGDSYQAQFDPNTWSGNVVAKTLKRNSDGSVSATDAVARWNAAQLLGARSTDGRTIVVGRRSEDVSSSGAATNFMWDSLDDWAKNALRTPATPIPPATLDSVEVGTNRVNYLRGVRSLETPAGNFRARNSLIGDIVNSGVTYKAEPDASLSDSGYAAFYNGLFDSSTKRLTRKKALYVGANDGMLHSFDADTGNELFAYIPGFLVPALTQLTNPSYIHRAYVDATPVVAEAQLNTSDAATWKTVLVSGAGAGAQGVFALDVTNPSAFGPSKVLWEFTDQNDPDLGNVVGQPKVVKVRTSAATGTASYKWYAVVASGVNSNAADGHFNESGRPALFFLELGKPLTQPWELGTNYFKVTFKQTSDTLPYGMVAFSTQKGPAGELVRLYGGDLQGNLWKLNFSSTTQANGVDVSVSAVLAGDGTKFAETPFFVTPARTAGRPEPQSITAEPALALGLNGTTIVSFGTGKFLEASDIAGPYTGQKQAVYVVLDDNLNRISGLDRLIARTAVNGTVAGDDFKWGSTGAGKLGWYINLPDSSSGERQVSGIVVRSGQLFFSTVIPAQGGCDPGSGNNFGPIDLATGAGVYVRSVVGLPGAPLTLDVPPDDDAPGLSDSTGRRVKKKAIQVISPGSDGTDTNIPPHTMPSVAYGRLSWRQIMNYQELHHNATTP